MRDYNSLCAPVTICATLVNIQTDRQTDRQRFDRLKPMTDERQNRPVLSADFIGRQNIGRLLHATRPILSPDFIGRYLYSTLFTTEVANNTKNTCRKYTIENKINRETN